MIKQIEACRLIWSEDGKNLEAKEVIEQLHDGWHGCFISLDGYKEDVFVMTVSNDLHQGNVLQMAIETLDVDTQRVTGFRTITNRLLEYEDAAVFRHTMCTDIDFEYVAHLLAETDEKEVSVDQINRLVPSKLIYPIYPRIGSGPGSLRATSFQLALDDIWWEITEKEAFEHGLQLVISGNSLLAKACG